MKLGPQSVTMVRRTDCSERQKGLEGVTVNQVHSAESVPSCLLSSVTASCKGLPFMTSALRGEGVSPKEDVVREVA